MTAEWSAASVVLLGREWKTVAEVASPVTTASVSLFSLDSDSRYLFRVFAVNARGLGQPSHVSDSLFVSGQHCCLSECLFH